MAPLLLALLAGAAGGGYEFGIERDWLPMKDGVRLAATYFIPRARIPGERFPVLLEFLPYRKEDSFYMRDYPLGAYFARHGFVVARVDVRGTGSSEGVAPPREYSDIELDDGVELIAQLAGKPWSNGNLGMYGISWSGFNSLQIAMRHPPALKAILVAHASDNVYQDGLEYIDGNLHVDLYHLQIHHENGLPRPPDYPLDAAYFRDRFEARPWLFTYLEQQNDGPFWRKTALRWDYSALATPVYFIGALLDGYRDAVPRLLEQAKVPVLAEIGPWNHAWPNDGEPGPNYEWRQRAVRWWDHWLRGRDTGILDEPRFLVYVRAGNPPDVALKTAPGQWRHEEWPIRRALRSVWYAAPDGRLGAAAPPADAAGLQYVASYGWAAGDWWGDPTPDMRPDDAGSLVFDSPALESPLEILGFPHVRLRVSVDAEALHFAARLEDVLPDGRVALVTGAGMNAAQRRSPLDPQPLAPGEIADLDFDLHFTTWTFLPGHRIRLAVSNAQFPMLWPNPRPFTLRLLMGQEASALELPQVPIEAHVEPSLPAPEPTEERPDAHSGECSEWPEGQRAVTHDLVRGTTRFAWGADCAYQILDRRYQVAERDAWETSDARPGASSYIGDETHRIELPGRRLELATHIEVRSDEAEFHVIFTRRIRENGKLLREKTWQENIPRTYQ